jgi:drug/metabolite transporter (DMT)-like permease
MILGSFFAAVYSIGGKKLAERYPPGIVTTAVAALGALFLLPLALIEGLRFDLPWHTYGILLLLGLGSGALANLWWMAILATTDASRAALALFLIPLIAAGLSVALLHEPITLWLVVGAALVLAGVIVVQRRT